MKRFSPFSRFVLLLALCGGLCRAATVSAQPRSVASSGFLGWKPEAQGRFITALCADARGVLWVGTEGDGLWKREIDGTWTQFSIKNDFADDTVLCLALDAQNRLWAGTARGGVAVWNGEKWRTFDVLHGPLGERVNDLALSPQGEMWLATDAGIARYSDANGWRYLSHLNGLPSNQIVALAFDADANLFAAAACDGLGIAHRADDYARWETVAGASIQPASPQGKGLPSNQLIDVAVDSKGRLWAATNRGLARSGDGGKSWSFLRGKNWKANVEGSARPLVPQDVPSGVEPLEEDWVVQIEPAADGQIWIGYRQKGFELREGETGELVYSWRDARGADFVETDYARAILPLANGAIVGTFGAGLQLSSAGKRGALALESKGAPFAPAPLPDFAAAPTVEQMRALTQRLIALPADPEVRGGFYGLDRRTRGNWVGRYGDRKARLYGMGRPNHEFRRAFNYDIGPEQVGPHGEGDGPYTYCYELETPNLNTLYSPLVGKRRASEMNDGSWRADRYPFSWQGPDLWASVEVPQGTHRVALYFHNFNGHSGPNRFRDYVVRLKADIADIKAAQETPDIAHGRVSDFWNGAYAQFWVQGPAKYLLQIERGASFGTILQGVFLDAVQSPPQPSDDDPLTWMGGVRYVTEPVPAPSQGEGEMLEAARALWNAAEGGGGKRGGVEAAWLARVLAYRAAASAAASDALLHNWRWKLAIWDESDEAEFGNTMALAWKKMSEQNTPKNAPQATE